MKISILTLIFFLLLGCAQSKYITVNCSDESIVAAQIYKLRTGNETFIAKSKDGKHAQAFTIINNKQVWLYVYPRFNWVIDEATSSDEFVGGIGKIYSVDEFIKNHNFRKIK